MRESFVTALMTTALTWTLVWSMGYTKKVDYVDVERAVSVCKDGKWNKINNSEIHCADGAVYPRRIEN